MRIISGKFKGKKILEPRDNKKGLTKTSAPTQKQYCGSKGIIFNQEKLQIAEEETEIFGFRMTQQGVKPSLNQLEAISEFKLPSQLRDIRQFVGLVIQSTFCLSQQT